MEISEIVSIMKEEIARQLTKERDGWCECEFKAFTQLAIDKIFKDHEDNILTGAMECFEEYGDVINKDVIRDYVAVWHDPLSLTIGNNMYKILD